jgi:hypothetical protein
MWNQQNKKPRLAPSSTDRGDFDGGPRGPGGNYGSSQGRHHQQQQYSSNWHGNRRRGFENVSRGGRGYDNVDRSNQNINRTWHTNGGWSSGPDDRNNGPVRHDPSPFTTSRANEESLHGPIPRRSRNDRNRYEEKSDLTIDVDIDDVENIVIDNNINISRTPMMLELDWNMYSIEEKYKLLVSYCH